MRFLSVLLILAGLFAAPNSALIARSALAQDLPLDPVAGILVAVRKAVGAAAVLLAVLEGALVDAAVLVLLGDDILCCGRSASDRAGKRQRQTANRHTLGHHACPRNNQTSPPEQVQAAHPARNLLNGAGGGKRPQAVEGRSLPPALAAFAGVRF